jgi:thiol-disulfide isomerase/thioredoxin
MSVGVWIVIAAVVVAGAFGSYRALTDGRFRGTKAVRGVDAEGSGSGVLPHVLPLDTPVEPTRSLGTTPAQSSAGPTIQHLLPSTVTYGDRATLVQFSSAFCAPCRATRRVLDQVASSIPGVVHVELDAEHHLDVVRAVGVLRTPTTLVLDASGAEVARAAGAPRLEQVLAALPIASE